MLIFADFPANFHKFQIFLEQPIFVAQKHQPYEKVSIFDGKYESIKIKQFAQVLSDILKQIIFKTKKAKK